MFNKLASICTKCIGDLFENKSSSSITQASTNVANEVVTNRAENVNNENKYKELQIKIHSNNREYAHGKAFKSENIKWIVIHYTACVNVSAKSMCKSMVNNTGASSHFYVDENDIYPSVPLKYIAWHVGDGKCKQPSSDKKMSLKELSNYHAKDWRYDLSAQFHLKCQENNEDFTSNSYCIGADLCVKKKSNKTKKATDIDWYFEDAAVDNMAKLVAYLMKTYDIDINHVIRHMDLTGKCCPRPFVSIPGDDSGETKWQEFKELVQHYCKYEQINLVYID